MPTTPGSPTMSPIGRDTPRVDGPLKVSGQARYTSDFHFPGMLYAVPVGATIANGRVVELDTVRARAMPGVQAIFHRENIGRSSVRYWDRGLPASLTSAARRSKTTSSATTANT
jgi:CO/xanthine dehydrogenase Mo-binding subunit